MAIIIACFFNAGYSEASSTSSVNATVKISVCGNSIVENGEDCESGDLQSRTCANLGFTDGSLTCDIACSFDTSNCNPPAINTNNVAPDELSSLLAAGYFSIPVTESIVSTNSLTTETQLTVSIPADGGTSSVILPEDLVITITSSADFDPTDLTSSGVSKDSVSGISGGTTVDGALQFGLLSSTLEFSAPVTVEIFVGNVLNGQTLNIYRSSSLTSGWTTDGLVSPAACLVSEEVCSFQTTKASYFAVIGSGASTSSSASSSSGSSSGSSSTSSNNSTSSSPAAPTAVPTPKTYLITSIFRSVLPRSIDVFDFDKDSKIETEEVFDAVQIWVNSWRGFMQEFAHRNEEKTGKMAGKCDVNRDNDCGLKDLSILLFYVER